MIFRGPSYSKMAEELLEDQVSTKKSSRTHRKAKKDSNHRPTKESTPHSKTTSYSVDDAVILFRSLTTHDASVVLDIATKALESAGVNLPLLLEEAESRSELIRVELEKLHSEIQMRQKRIAELEAQQEDAQDILTKVESVLNQRQDVNNRDHKPRLKVTLKSSTDAKGLLVG